MHPMDQTSTAGPYSLTLMSSSGARYQSVTTFRVSGRYGLSQYKQKATKLAGQAEISDFEDAMPI